MQQRPQKPPMPNWSGLSKNLALWLLVALLAAWFFNREKPVEVTVVAARPMPEISEITEMNACFLRASR